MSGSRRKKLVRPPLICLWQLIGLHVTCDYSKDEFFESANLSKDGSFTSNDHFEFITFPVTLTLFDPIDQVFMLN